MYNMQIDRITFIVLKKLKEYEDSIFGCFVSFTISFIKLSILSIVLIFYSSKELHNSMRFFLFLSLIINIFYTFIYSSKLMYILDILITPNLQETIIKNKKYESLITFCNIFLYASVFGNSISDGDCHTEMIMYSLFLLTQMIDVVFMFSKMFILFYFIILVNLMKKTEELKTYKNIDLINECSICMDDYKHDDKITELVCNHIYHHDCIIMWLNRNNSCPICKRNMDIQMKIYEDVNIKL